MAIKTKEERLAEQKALIEKAMQNADRIEGKPRNSQASSIVSKNIAKDAQMKLEKAHQMIEELKAQIVDLKNNESSPDLIKALEEQIESLRSKATLELNPNEVIVTRFANRDEVFFKTGEFWELVESIRENGQAIPITVRASQSQDSFELISGRRRLEACKILELPVTAILVQADDKKLTELQVLENFRDDLTHFEEADNFELMITEGFFKSNAELAKTFSISEGKISQLRSIAKIPKWFRQEFLIKENVVSRKLPSGIEKEVVELDIAPSRLCYDLSRFIKADFDERYNQDIQPNKLIILAIADYKKRVEKLISILERKSLPIKESKNAIKQKIKFDDKVIAETVKSDGSLQIKVPRKHNSKELTQAIEDAVNKVINDFFTNP